MSAMGPGRTTRTTRHATAPELARELLANTYMRLRPPLWMKKNRRVFALTRRLCQLALRCERGA